VPNKLGFRFSGVDSELEQGSPRLKSLQIPQFAALCPILNFDARIHSARRRFYAKIEKSMQENVHGKLEYVNSAVHPIVSKTRKNILRTVSITGRLNMNRNP